MENGTTKAVEFSLRHWTALRVLLRATAVSPLWQKPSIPTAQKNVWVPTISPDDRGKKNYTRFLRLQGCHLFTIVTELFSSAIYRSISLK